MSWFSKVLGALTPLAAAVATPAIDVDSLTPRAYAGQTNFDPFENSLYDGGKFAGGFGPTQVQTVDYWTLRARSAQLFNENLYARGLIRRLITNEINTGLTPESAPDEQILGLAEDSLADWTENVENRFGLWAKNPQVCDWLKESTFGEIQRTVRREALVEGDILVVLLQDPATKLPAIQLVGGSSVQTPYGSAPTQTPTGHEIVHGVEKDALGRVFAYHIRQKDGSFSRILAYGKASKRRQAWLVFGTDKRLDDTRGQPLLSLVLQSLKEIDRYRDSTQRKAVINSILAMFVAKGEDKPGTLPFTGGAVRRGQVEVSDNTTAGTPRKFNISGQVPGMVIEELQHGETVVSKGGEGTDTNFGQFEEAIIQAVAWANEIPPEILTLAFSNNYSASQAAINEFKIYLNLRWAKSGEELCSPVYNEWLVSEALNRKIAAPGLLEAWRDPSRHDILSAWVSVDWYGSIKPSTDTLKQAKGSQLLVGEGWSTNAREARVTTGTKFSKNIKRLTRENEQKAKALRPLLELQAEFGTENTEKAVGALEDMVLAAVESARDN